MKFSDNLKLAMKNNDIKDASELSIYTEIPTEKLEEFIVGKSLPNADQMETFCQLIFIGKEYSKILKEDYRQWIENERKKPKNITEEEAEVFKKRTVFENFEDLKKKYALNMWSELGKMTGVHDQSIVFIYKYNKLPTLFTVNKFCDTFGANCTPEVLLGTNYKEFLEKKSEKRSYQVKKKGKKPGRGIRKVENLGNTDIARMIYEFRKANGYSRNKVGKMCGINPSTVRAYEMGIYRPSPEAKEKLIKVISENNKKSGSPALEDQKDTKPVRKGKTIVSCFLDDEDKEDSVSNNTVNENTSVEHKNSGSEFTGKQPSRSRVRVVHKCDYCDEVEDMEDFFAPMEIDEDCTAMLCPTCKKRLEVYGNKMLYSLLKKKIEAEEVSAKN